MHLERAQYRPMNEAPAKPAWRRTRAHRKAPAARGTRGAPQRHQNVATAENRTRAHAACVYRAADGRDQGNLPERAKRVTFEEGTHNGQQRADRPKGPQKTKRAVGKIQPQQTCTLRQSAPEMARDRARRAKLRPQGERRPSWRRGGWRNSGSVATISGMPTVPPGTVQGT